MDGIETARMIRSRERTRHLPIIFVTARPQHAADARGISAVRILEATVRALYAGDAPFRTGTSSCNQLCEVPRGSPSTQRYAKRMQIMK